MGNLKIGSGGIALIKQFEGFRSAAYFDSHGHLWTIGYGSTGKLSDGTPVVQGLSITKERAANEIPILCGRRYGAHVNKVITRELKQNEFDALCSMAWNRGSLRRDLISAVNANNKKAIYDAFMAISTSGGEVLAGLVKRRKAEIKLYFEGTSEPVPDVAGGTSTQQSYSNGFVNGAGSNPGTPYSDFFSQLNKGIDVSTDPPKENTGGNIEKSAIGKVTENSTQTAINSTTQNTTEGISKSTSKPVSEIKENNENSCG